ncbi:MAG TPA: ferritin-like domain-containing protein [Bryobacteraceae bacterium]|nr:ferritin-like domain-containing protein [Bryobacteraceae bacterium]
MRPKLFPRNLTAQAAKLVAGNPATSRPESGTDVCTPGLEIDLRALEERFFPGLLWDFERGDGARLVGMDEEVQGLQRHECLTEDAPVFLLGLCAKMRAADKGVTFFRFDSSAGRAVWRRVRDLPKTRVAILFGVRERMTPPLGQDELLKLLRQVQETGSPVIKKSGTAFAYAAMAAPRAAYLHPDTGVIPELFAPGELTKGLCSPWQFDFRDCGCNYWAAGKPDMVQSGDPAVGPVNYGRNRTKHPHTQDSPDRGIRNDAMYTASQMVAGAWKALPPVLGDRERNTLPPPRQPAGKNLFHREEAATELAYLATVEHALVVEYLYAAYSTHDRQAAAVIQSIAIDEMRHLLWVNELLQILGYAPSTTRAAVIGADPAKAEPGCGRRRMQEADGHQPTYIHVESRLRSLTLATLDYFIDVEKNSRTLNGLYTHLYLSIDAQPEEFPENVRLTAILRLIIDEGEDHYARLATVRTHLAARPENEWLRNLQRAEEPYPPAYGAAAAWYHLLLHIISVSFRLDNGRASLLQMAKELMQDLDAAICQLQADGVEFDWPEPPAADEETLEEALPRLHGYVSRIGSPSQRLFDAANAAEALIRAGLRNGQAPLRPSAGPCRYMEVRGR